MKVRKVISRDLEHEVEDKDGKVSVAGSLSAVLSANVNEPGSQRVRVSSRRRIVQRDGRTEVFEEHHSSGDGFEEPATKEESDD